MPAPIFMPAASKSRRIMRPMVFGSSSSTPSSSEAMPSIALSRRSSSRSGRSSAPLPSSLRPLEIANTDIRRSSSGRPQRGHAGRRSVFTRREKKLNTVWQSTQ